MKRSLLFAALTVALLAACSSAGSDTTKILDVLNRSIAADNYRECVPLQATSAIVHSRDDGKMSRGNVWYEMLQKDGYATRRPYQSGDGMPADGDYKDIYPPAPHLESWALTKKADQIFAMGTDAETQHARMICFARPHVVSISSDVSANDSFDTAAHTVKTNEALQWDSWVTPSDKTFIEAYYKTNPGEASLLPDPKPGHENAPASFNVDEPTDGSPVHLAGQ